MIDNIYSTKFFAQISEVARAEVYEAEVVIDDETRLRIFGIGVLSHLTFGIYAPFWVPAGINELSLRQLEEFTRELISQAQVRGYKEISIRLPPVFYAKNVALLKFQLARSGFERINMALWQSIDCQRYDSVAAYEASLKHSARKVLRRFSENYAFELRELNSADMGNIEKIYAVLECNRERLGVRLKYSLHYLKQFSLVEAARVKIFEFSVDGNCVAVALCHMTRCDVLYVVAWGDINHGLAHSPMYKFSAELVGYCLKYGIKHMDFGVSSDLHLYTPNLFDFKSNIGCECTLQETFLLKCEA